jgi:hypothetical protein
MSRRGEDMMGNSDGSYHWRGGTAVGSSFTNDAVGQFLKERGGWTHGNGGNDGDGRGAALAPGTMSPLPLMMTTPTIMTMQRRDISVGWEDDTRTIQIITMGMKTRGNARFGLAAASRRWTFGRFSTWN